MCYNTVKSTFKDTFMVINANEVKLKVFHFLEIFWKNLMSLYQINIHEKDKYVVLDVESYKEFRQNKLDLACIKAMQDIKNGYYKIQSVKEHFKKLLDKVFLPI